MFFFSPCTLMMFGGLVHNKKKKKYISKCLKNLSVFSRYLENQLKMYSLKCVPLLGASFTCTKQEITSHFYGTKTQKKAHSHKSHISLSRCPPSSLSSLHICSPRGDGHILTAIHPDLISQPSIQISPHCHPSRSHLTAIHPDLFTVFHPDLTSRPSIQIYPPQSHPFRYILLTAIHLELSSLLFIQISTPSHPYRPVLTAIYPNLSSHRSFQISSHSQPTQSLSQPSI
jgi:hypothetical protein